MVDKFWPLRANFPPKNIRGNEILFNYCPKIYDRKKKLSDTFRDTCRRMQRLGKESLRISWAQSLLNSC